MGLLLCVCGTLWDRTYCLSCVYNHARRRPPSLEFNQEEYTGRWELKFLSIQFDTRTMVDFIHLDKCHPLFGTFPVYPKVCFHIVPN